MTAGGALELACERRGERSVVSRIVATGLARASRPLRRDDGLPHVVTSTLGPGAIAGDAHRIDARIGPGAALAVSGQMATPVFPGARPTELTATWHVATGGVVCAVAEPLLPVAGSDLRVHTTIEVAGDGVAIVAELLGGCSGVRLGARTTARIDGRLVVRDALDLDAATPPRGAAGTLYVITRDPAVRARITALAWQQLERTDAVRGGAGTTDGAVVVRIAGAPFAIRETLRTLAYAASMLVTATNCRPWRTPDDEPLKVPEVGATSE